MHPVPKQISDIGIVPVIAIDDAEKAVPLAKALVAGGLPVAEVIARNQHTFCLWCIYYFLYTRPFLTGWRMS